MDRTTLGDPQSIERLAETGRCGRPPRRLRRRRDETSAAQMAEAELYGVENSSQAKSVLLLCRTSGPMALRSARSSARVHALRIACTGEVRHFAVECTSYRHSASSRVEAVDYIVTHVLRLSSTPPSEAWTDLPSARGGSAWRRLPSADVRDEVIQNCHVRSLPRPEGLGQRW